jgi:hypothetical protein
MNRLFNAAFIFVFGIGIAFTKSSSGDGTESLLPRSDTLTGWTMTESPKKYSSDNLYEYIDGEAEMYLAYGFKQLVTAVYASSGGQDSPSITVDIYDMGSLIDAFGVYSSYRYPDYRFEPIGAESMISDYDIKFYQGRYFIHVTLSDNTESISQTGRKAAQWIAQHIQEQPKAPKELALLPADNQVDKTIKYTAKEMLSQSFLPGGLEAKYRITGGEATGFVVIFKSLEDAGKGLESLQAFYEKSGETVEKLANHTNGFSANTEYHGKVMVSSVGRFLAGVQDMADADQAMSLLNQIAANLKNK